MLESIIVSLALTLTFVGVPGVALGGFVVGVAGQGERVAPPRQEGPDSARSSGRGVG